MLKALKPDTFAGIANAKCGEIYFQSLNSYRIDCSFCEMKSFVFSDFLLHIQNEHFENGLLKAEPKLEKEIEEGQPAKAATNTFTWYEVGREPEQDAEEEEESEHEFMDRHQDKLDESEPDNDEEVKDPVSITIMKWNREGRHTRAMKIDYNEDSEQEQDQQHQKKQQHISCQQCDKTYQSKKTLQRHIDRHHRQQDYEKADADLVVDMDAMADLDYDPPKPLSYKCEHCDKSYQGKYTLRQHIKRDHDISLSENFVCLECNAQLPRLRLLDEHVVKMHGGAPCVICGRRYKTRHELKRHQLKHTNERNVPCSHPGCEKRFFTMRHMRNHSKVHSEQKNFVCESCGYSCRNKETLRVHLRSHTGERPFGCQVCSKRFPSHSGLREHMAMHSTERPHVCKVCGATFSRQKGLYHHKFLHTATKQFVCKLCGNAYAQAAGLAGHMRKHRNDELNG